jgi:hypothetical protein
MCVSKNVSQKVHMPICYMDLFKIINSVNQQSETGLLSKSCEYEGMITDHEVDVIYGLGIYM